MRFLWYDTFKDGKTIRDAPHHVLLEENMLAWSSHYDDSATRFFPVIQDHDETVRGAVVHILGLESYDKALEFAGTIPWMVHNFADGKIVPFQNFVTVEKLFHQNGKYTGLSPLTRTVPFDTNPNVTWYAIITAKTPSEYEEKYCLEDAIVCFRLMKGTVTEEVFDLMQPLEGKILRIKANTREEVEGYVNELASVRAGDATVEISRTISSIVWVLEHLFLGILARSS